MRTKSNCAKSIIKGLARHNREKETRYWQRLENGSSALCIDDVTGKELPWHVVREAREQELKYFRDFGVCEESR